MENDLYKVEFYQNPNNTSETLNTLELVFNPKEEHLNLNVFENVVLKPTEEEEQVLYKNLDISLIDPFKLEQEILNLSKGKNDKIGFYMVNVQNFEILNNRLKEFYFNVFSELYRYNKIRNSSRKNFIQKQDNLNRVIYQTENNTRLKEENRVKQTKQLKTRFNDNIAIHKQVIKYLSGKIFKVSCVFEKKEIAQNETETE